MKVLLVNKFLYPQGGDAISTLATGSLLTHRGHEVSFWGMDHPLNPYYADKEYFAPFVDYQTPMKKWDKLKAGMNAIYSFEARRRFEGYIKLKEPDVVHLSNFYHQISPSILSVLKKYRIPSVMTMRDYKIVCASYSMLLGGRPCDKCRNGKYFNGFLYRCTKSSSMMSFVNMIEMYLHHKILHSYDNIDIFISPSKFLKSKVKEMGFERDVVYLPNFPDLENFDPAYNYGEESIVYAGRLSHEKGLVTLLDAVKGLDIRLKIIGDGPMKEDLLFKVRREGMRNVEFLGYKKSEDLKSEIKRSIFLVIPSEWYENNPRAVIEAFALGKAVVGARIGGIPELVRDNETGFTFESGNSYDLREKITLALNSKARMIAMGKTARAFVERELNPESHYEKLIGIYQSAIRQSQY